MKVIDRYKKALNELARAIENNQVDATKLLRRVLQLAIQVRLNCTNGKLELVGNYAWVVRKEFDPETYKELKVADVFMYPEHLPEFAENPNKYIPEGIYPDLVYIFGTQEDFIDQIAPHIIRLLHQGAQAIHYFGWNGSDYGSFEAIERILDLIEMISKTESYSKFKKSITQDGTYNIRDLAYIKKIKNLAKVI